MESALTNKLPERELTIELGTSDTNTTTKSSTKPKHQYNVQPLKLRPLFEISDLDSDALLV